MKKVLSLILAVTTVLTMFATCVSALFVIESYSESKAYLDAYSPTRIRLTEQKFIVTQPQHKTGANDIATEIATIEDLIEFSKHLDFSAPDKAPVIFEALKETTGNDDLRYGKIYMYDYAYNLDPSTDESYAKALADFKEMVDELLVATPENADITIADFYSAWENAYRIKATLGIENVPPIRLEAIERSKAISSDVTRYMTEDYNGNLRPNSSMFDTVFFAEYNIYTLIQDAYNTGISDGTLSNSTTSELVYLNEEYGRLKKHFQLASTISIQDSYYDLYDEVVLYKESDYTSDNWAKVQEYIAEAEELASKATTLVDWQNARKALMNAIRVEGIPVDYMELEEALLSVYSDADGVSTTDYIQKEYSGLAEDNCIHLADNYKNGSAYSGEWTRFAINYYSTNTNTIKVIEKYSAYTWLYNLWERIKQSSTAYKQSEVDQALYNFYRALENLENPAMEGKCGDNVTWSVDTDGVLTISGEGRMWNSNGFAHWNPYMVKSVIIEDGVTNIGDKAFYGCGALTSIEFPDSVTSIGKCAFQYCTSLTSLEFPDTVKRVESVAFADCASLTTVDLGDGVTRVSGYAFEDCNSIVSFKFSSNMEGIGAFFTNYTSDYRSLATIEIPQGVTHIQGSFRYCPSLTSVKIPYGVENISRSFIDCASLKMVEIPDTVTWITAFEECPELTDVYYTGTEEQWNEIFNNSIENVTVHFNSSMPSETPEETTVNISGAVTAYGDDSKGVTIELLDGETVVDAKTVTGNSGTYAFENVEAGTYTLRVSKSKHAVREYEITVADADVTQDAAIWLYGDVTADGIVNAGDTLQINRKISNLSSVFNQTADADYRFKVANVTNLVMDDVILNAADILQINRKVANLSSVFDRIA